jgi:hypothetical protein
MEACQKVVHHEFSLSLEEAKQQESVNYRKVLRYSGMVGDQFPQIIQVLGTENWCLTGSCIQRYKIYTIQLT